MMKALNTELDVRLTDTEQSHYSVQKYIAVFSANLC